MSAGGGISQARAFLSPSLLPFSPEGEAVETQVRGNGSGSKLGRGMP